MPPHDHNIPYAETYIGPTATPFTHHTDGRTLTLRGICPTCQGVTTSEYAYGIPGTGTKGIFSRSQPDPPETQLLAEFHYCECGHAHPQLPPDAPFIGCGASWKVTNLQAGTA
ncbi:hypothetical protein IAG44_32670 [Streptomyces roseirectus]|uniref:Uncharacterized protein n=1 Tax=Streptomyces roseirectus TaxID=2768066 RepID=A0A7H0ILT2_9ACTN|nr:hypothetical protein [Streptomyces roseirectus]QNP73748.1 hypothetical protein IAG44_32670 [Streptomyces roseirectus]